MTMTGTRDQDDQQPKDDAVSALGDPALIHHAARGPEHLTDRGPRAGQALERVTANLTSRSSRALNLATDLTGDSKTDTVNRALQVYAYLMQITSQGGAIYVREESDGKLERLAIF